MKRVIIGLVLAMATAQTASADVYVKVDAQGNAIGGAIMCDAATCGEGSLYSSLTLQPGERYVLQGVGVHHGIGNNNPGVDVKHEATTNEWVVTNNNAPEPVVERFTVNTPAPVVQDPVPVAPVAPVDTKTVTIDTATVVTDTATATETITAQIDYSDIDWEAMDWETFNWEDFLTWLTAYIDDLLAVKP
jgi:hypothetical protein